jgi:hypothetical protein
VIKKIEGHVRSVSTQGQFCDIKGDHAISMTNLDIFYTILFGDALDVRVFWECKLKVISRHYIRGASAPQDACFPDNSEALCCS